MNNDNDPTTCIHIWKLLMKNMILTNSGLSTCTYNYKMFMHFNRYFNSVITLKNMMNMIVSKKQ